MRTFRGLTAIRTGTMVAALAAVILAGVFTVFRAGATGPGELIEVKKLNASNAQAGHFFGVSVAISDDTAIVGARGEDTGGFSAGAAYVFERNQGGADNWGEVTKLTASDAQAYDYFGISVAISSDTAVVTATGEDAGGTDAGAAYVFQRDDGGADNWGQVKKLIATDAQSADLFGASVAISGDTAVIGAFLEDTGAAYGGAAYVFQRDQGGAGNWGETKKLIASDAQMFDFFGRSVAVSGDTVVVGAWQEDAGGNNAGAAYVFQRNQGGAGNWGEAKKLLASDAQTGDGFGVSLGASGYSVIVGAYQQDAAASNAGAAYTFERDQGGPGAWGEVEKLTASDAEADDFFGAGVGAAISGETAIVGAHREDAAATDAGAAYVFEPPLLSWSPLDTAASSGTNILDVSDVSIYSLGDTVLISPGSANEETRTVIGFGSLLLDAPLDFDHRAGEPVVVAGGSPVGGIAELPEAAGTPLETGGSGSGNAGVLAGVAGSVAAGAVAMGGAALYARRRRNERT